MVACDTFLFRFIVFSVHTLNTKLRLRRNTNAAIFSRNLIIMKYTTLGNVVSALTVSRF